MELLKKIWEDPFAYAFGAFMVILAAAFVVRFAKDTFEEFFSD
jgi:hypothetical protein